MEVRASLGWALGCSLALAACSGNDDDTISHDVSADGGIDSGRAEGGPSGDGDGDSDGGERDASVNDASTPDASDAATPSGFRITVMSPSGPIEGADVFLHDSTGTLIGTRKTDNAGEVFEAEAPGAVTVRDTFSTALTGQRLITYLATEGGDDLVIWLDDRPLQQPLDRTFSINYPANPPGAADRYELRYGQGCRLTDHVPTAENPQEFEAYASCMRPTNAFLAGVFDENNALLAYSFSANDVSDPGAGNAGSVTLTGWNSAALEVGLSNLPSYFNDFADARLDMVRSGSHFAASPDPADTTTNLLMGEAQTFLYAPNFADTLTAKTEVLGVPDYLVRAEQARSGNASTNYTFDYDLPRFTSVNAEGTVGDFTISWELDEPLAGADVQFAWAEWNGGLVQWLVAIPPSVSSFSFPKLVHGTTAEPSPPVDIPDVLAAFDDTGIAGYTEFKRLPLVLGDFGTAIPMVSLPIYAAPTGEFETLRAISIEPSPL